MLQAPKSRPRRVINEVGELYILAIVGPAAKKLHMNIARHMIKAI